jgi:hypothetical protein
MNKTPIPDFTLDQLLADLAGPEQSLEGYHTAREWRAILNTNEKRMGELLRLADEQGKLKVTKAPRRQIDGVMRQAPVYAFELTGKEVNHA